MHIHPARAGVTERCSDVGRGFVIDPDIEAELASSRVMQKYGVKPAPPMTLANNETGTPKPVSHTTTPPGLWRLFTQPFETA